MSPGRNRRYLVIDNDDLPPPALQEPTLAEAELNRGVHPRPAEPRLVEEPTRTEAEFHPYRMGPPPLPVRSCRPRPLVRAVPAARAKVRCRGKDHLIIITTKGRVFLPNHPHSLLRHWASQPPPDDFYDDWFCDHPCTCGCAEAFQAWRAAVAGRTDVPLPRGLRTAAKAHARKIRSRRRRQARTKAPTTFPGCGCDYVGS
jgi:hypothetical protein